MRNRVRVCSRIQLPPIDVIIILGELGLVLGLVLRLGLGFGLDLEFVVAFNCN